MHRKLVGRERRCDDARNSEYFDAGECLVEVHKQFRSAEKRSARPGLYSIDARARSREEDAAVFAPSDVRRKLRYEDAPEQCAIRAAHPDAAGSRGENV